MTDDTWQFGTLRPQTYRLFTFDPPWKMRMGTGKRPQHYPRMTDEEALLFKFRRPPPRLDKGIRELIVSPLREHSRKPEEFYANCEKFGSPSFEVGTTSETPLTQISLKG